MIESIDYDESIMVHNDDSNDEIGNTSSIEIVNQHYYQYYDN